MVLKKTLEGIMFQGKNVTFHPVTIRATSDKLGKSLSLSVDEEKIMIEIPADQIDDILRLLRGGKEHV